MLLLRAGGSAPVRTRVLGIALVALGLAVLLSGIALLLVLAAAGTALGGAVVLFRKLTGRPLMRPAARRPGLEVEADYEILPPMHDRPGERRGDLRD